MLSLALPALLVLAPSPGTPGTPAASDVVRLENGKELEGRVVYEDEEELVIRIGSKNRTLDQEDVASVESHSRYLARFLEEIASARGLDAWLQLARDCTEWGLTREARLCWLKVLLAEPDNDEANAALEHIERSGKWLVPHGGKYLPWEKYLKVHEKWRDAWELGTTHFDLRTNLELSAGINAAFDLELLVHNLYSELAVPLRLYDVLEPMKAEIHGRGDSFRSGPVGSRGWFDRSAEALLVDAGPDPTNYDRALLVHEACHELFYFTLQENKKGRSSLPPWLDEGLAEYFASQSRSGNGRRFDYSERKHRTHFERHASAEEPLTLSRLLNLEFGEFQAGRDTDLRYAQCYTLVHFLMKGDGQSWRARFHDYLRNVYAGKGSSAAFRKAMGGKKQEKAIEQGWTEHATSESR